MSHEYEQALLGAALLEPSLLDGEKITADLFLDPRHRLILDAMRSLRESGWPVDLLTLHDELKDRLQDAGGTAYLASLTNMSSAANAGYYLDKLREEARRRALDRLSKQIEDGLFRGKDSGELLTALEGELLRLRSQGVEDRTVRPRDALRQIVEKAEERAAAGAEGCTGIPSGFPTLDSMTGGFQAGDLVLVGARTSIGKTSLALSWIEYQIQHGIPVALASLEMSAVQVWERLLAMRSFVSTGRLRFGRLDTDALAALRDAAGALESCGALNIIDRPDLSVRALRSWAFQAVGEGARILYVDYAGLLLGGNDTAPRWERMAEVSRSLKSIARELRIPVIALVQLNREAAEAQAPGLHNIRDSGSFEQDADIALILTRKIDKSDTADSVPGELHISKHRNGPTGRIALLFRRSLTQFREGSAA